MLLYWSAWLVARMLARLLFRLKVEGGGNIPKKGGVIIAANHASYLDIPILGCGASRRLSFMGRIDLFHGVIGAVMRYLGWIPIRRERVDRRGFDEAIRRVKAGEAVVIYPEGGRSDDGKLQPGKPGIGIIVEATGCPVIPTLLEGTYDALPPDAKWIRLRPIRVVYGPPMDFSSLLGRENGEEKKAVYQQISQEIMDRISALGGGMPSSAGCRSASI